MAEKDRDEVKRTVRLKIQRSFLPSARPPKPAHRFLFSRVGDQVSLDVGYLDSSEMFELMHRLDSAEKGKKASPAGKKTPERVVNLYVTDTFLLSPQAALELLAISQQIVEDLRRIGLVTPLQPPKEPSHE